MGVQDGRTDPRHDGVSKGKINRPTLEAELATAGEEGWELVHFWPDTNLHQEKDGNLLIFKRPAE